MATYQRSVVKRIDGYVIVIDPCLASNGSFWPRYWIYAEDSLAARPIASQEVPVDGLDHSAASSLAEELARARVAGMSEG